MRTVHKLVTSQMSFEKSVKNQGPQQSLIFISLIFSNTISIRQTITKGEKMSEIQFIGEKYGKNIDGNYRQIDEN